MLNLPGFHTTAAIVAEVEDTQNKARAYTGYQMQPNIVCRITDCDGHIDIEFDVGTANQLENSLHKLDTMVETLKSMRNGLVVEHHRLQDRLDRWPADKRGELYELRRALGKRSRLLPKFGRW